MSNSKDMNPLTTNLYEVGNPVLPTHDSFLQSTANDAIRSRMAQARRDWRRTDGDSVVSYSYSLDILQLHFECVTLEIVGNAGSVDWKIKDRGNIVLDGIESSSILLHADSGRREFFDRIASLELLVGKRIRYSPTETGIFILWQPKQELYVCSLPLISHSGWILYYPTPVGQLPGKE